jgi:hypothetical protein
MLVNLLFFVSLHKPNYVCCIDRRDSNTKLNCGSRLVYSSCLNHMRALFVLLILVAVLMNTVKCPGCSQAFNQGIAIKAHQRTCAGLRLVGQKRINKRLQNAQKREAVKLARIDGQSVDDIIEERQELREDLDDNMVHYPPEVLITDLPAGPSTVS